jgi:hypothetical protein
MPIRRARVMALPASEAHGWLLSLVIIGVLAGLALAFGDHTASRSTTPPLPTIEPYRSPSFEFEQYDPLMHLDELHFEDPLAMKPVEHVVLHVKQLHDGELFATGEIIASEPIENITVAAECRDLAGAPLGTYHAVVACKRMQAGERCAWMLEHENVGAVAEIEFEARARRALGFGPPQLELRSDRPGELTFDAKQRTVKFELRERPLSEAWATVTAYSPAGGVLGVAQTRYSGSYQPGRHRFEVALPETAGEIGSYEVRVGGSLLDW